MAAEHTLNVESRAARGKWAVRRLRKEGTVPGIVYGSGQGSDSVQFSAREFGFLVRHGVRVLELKCNGQSQTAFIRDLQWDTFGKEIIHVDFERVEEGQRVEVQVGVQIRGTAPGVTAGGAFEHFLHELEIECPAAEIPDAIVVDVNQLGLNSAIHVKDLRLPEGVVVLHDADAVVAQVVVPQEELEPEAEVAGAAEPEIVGRRVAEESSE